MVLGYTIFIAYTLFTFALIYNKQDCIVTSKLEVKIKSSISSCLAMSSKSDMIKDGV